MTGLSVAAFVASKPVRPSELVLKSCFFAATTTTTKSTTVRHTVLPHQRQSDTALSMAALGGGNVANYSAAASGFFTSIRVPAALIAGSSLAAVFTLVKESRDEEVENRNVVESLCLLIYHVLALSSLLLSLNVVFTATATANAILLGAKNPMATSAYAMLQREFPFDFLATRWSFYSALFCFLGSIASRALLEFGLLTRKRIRSALLVVFPVSSLGFHLVALVNSRPPSFPRMTYDLFHMYFVRCLTGQKTICELASVFSFVAALVTAVQVFRLNRLRLFSRANGNGQNKNEANHAEGNGGESNDEVDAKVEDIYSSLDGTKPIDTVTPLEANTATTESPSE